MLASVLAVLAPLPLLFATLMTGDAPQFLVKPPRDLVYRTFSWRYRIIALSAALLAAALAAHVTVEPTSLLLLVVAALLAAALAVAAFYAVPFGLFPGVRTPRWRRTPDVGSELQPDDEVIGLEVDGDARAYPVGWIARPHVVIDDVGGRPVAMTYCVLSHLAVAYRAELDGVRMRPVVMEQLENNLVTYDPQTDSILQQIDCEVSHGEAVGRGLEVLPARVMPWSAWRALYPESQVFYHPPASPVDRLARRFLRSMVGRQWMVWFNYRPGTRLLADLPETWSPPTPERLQRVVL